MEEITGLLQRFGEQKEMRNDFSIRCLNKFHSAFQVVTVKLGCSQAGLVCFFSCLVAGMLKISHKLLDDCKSSSPLRGFLIIVYCRTAGELSAEDISVEKADTFRSMGNHMDMSIGYLPRVSIDALKYVFPTVVAIGNLQMQHSSCTEVASNNTRLVWKSAACTGH